MKKALKIGAATFIMIALMSPVALARTYKIANEDAFVKAIVADCFARELSTVIIPVKGFKTNSNRAKQLIVRAITSNGDILNLVNRYTYSISTTKGKWVVTSVRLCYSFVETKDQSAKVDGYIRGNILPIVNEAQDDYEKVYLINEWIKNHVSYDTTHKNQSSYNAIFAQKAVCNGYAMLFNKIAKASGLEAKVITGKSKNMPHAWNAVKINGLWYFVDCTWNDTTEFNEYLLLNLPDISADHRAETLLPQPIAPKSYFAELAEKIKSGDAGNAIATMEKMYGAFCPDKEALEKEVQAQLETKNWRQIICDSSIQDVIPIVRSFAESGEPLKIITRSDPLIFNNKAYTIISLDGM